MGRTADGDKPPARVLTLAAQIGDEPLKWTEYEDGSITIVFCNKGKRTFLKESESEAPTFEPIIHTNEDAQAVVQTLAPSRKPHPKRKEK